MAKQTLSTNFKDDIPTIAMNKKRKYRKTSNADGTICLEDVTDYLQLGSDFIAADINATNTAINAAADKAKLLTSLDDVLACTQSGYLVDTRVIKTMVEG